MLLVFLVDLVLLIFSKLSLNSTQLKFNFKFNFEAEIALFSDNTATQPPTLGLGDIPKVNILRFLEKIEPKKKLIS